MTDILKRLNEASGPDYKLNIAIFKFLHPEYADYVEGRGGLVHTCDGADQRVLSDVRPGNYTSSIDAALALVERMLPGWYYTITSHNTSMGNKPWCDLATHEYIHSDELVEGGYFESAGPTIPIAILTALFSALEAKG